MASLDLRQSVLNSSLCECDNCDWFGRADETLVIADPHERLAAGAIVPVGECPACRSLAYLKPREDMIKELCHWARAISDGTDGIIHAICQHLSRTFKDG